MPNDPSSTPLRALSAIFLCLLLPGQLLQTQLLQAQLPPGKPPAPRLNGSGSTAGKPDTKLDSKPDPDQRILHLLSRFTFGPTPDEIAAVREFGPSHAIDKWFDEQLHPDRIPASKGDEILAARLAEFPALQLPVDELLARFPSGALIRQTANGKLPVPSDPYYLAIYHRHIDMFEEKQAKKNQIQPQAESAKSAPANPAMAPAASMAVKPAASPVEPAIAEQPKPDQAKPAPKPQQVADTARPAYADLLFKNLIALPPAQRVHRILFMQPAEYEQLNQGIKGPQKAQLTQDMTPDERELLADYENPTRAIIEEQQAQRLLRDIYSSHQLQEVMTTFWLNHFNVYLHKNEETPYYLVSYERDVIRPRALGNFEDLLVATAESPAMLLYLDNSTSTGPDSIVAEKQKERAAAGKAAKATPPGLNENYARELMELHTLGVNGGYTQKDVTEVAKVFTGWTVDRPQLGGGFRSEEHTSELQSPC